MSLYDVTAEVESVLRTGPLARKTIVDVYLDTGTRHYSNSFATISLDDGTGDGTVTYEPMGSRLITPEKSSENQSLDNTSLTITLDSSRATDLSDPVGSLLAETLTQRRVRLRTVLFRPGTHETEALWLYNVREGVINTYRDDIEIDGVSALQVSIASGSFAYLERRNLTFSAADQADLYPGDTSMTHAAQLAGVSLPWYGEFG